MHESPDLAAQLWNLWQQGQRPRVYDILSTGEDGSLAQLAEVLWVDQRERWRVGERVPAESYLQRYPALQSNAEMALELVFGEILLREARGETPGLHEYVDRFPLLAERLKQQFEVHQALKPSATAPEPPPGPPTRTDRAGLQTAPGSSWPRLPDYAILGELGEGGMGVVYQARQLRLDRLVALKMMRGRAFAGPEERARFYAEAGLVALLQHPNIVQIFDVAEHEGQPYLALELVAGGNLAEQIAGLPQPATQAAALVETLARAMHHAHQRGVIHRDLKPANVLLVDGGQWTVDGARTHPPSTVHLPLFTPKITDFGVAKRLDRGNGLTPSQAILGTPSYMAPEQAEGKNKEVTPRADVYALGAILYEMLTGRPPFLGETSMDTLQQVVSQEPVPPSRLQPKVPRDLEIICLKCLEKQPAKRYASAEVLADDLRRWRGGEPIQARPVSRIERLWRWSRRKPAIAGLLAVLTVVVVASLAVLTHLWLLAEDRRGQAEAQRERAERNFRRAREAVDRYCTQIGESEELKVHALEELRQNLLQAAKDFYEEFVKDASDDPGILAEQARGYARLATLTGLIESKTKALPLQRQALVICDKLVEAHPHVSSYQRDLAAAYNALGELHRDVGEMVQAEASYVHALNILDRLVVDHPTTADYLSDRAVNLNDLASVYRDKGESAKAEKAFQQALTLRLQLNLAQPGHAAYQRDLVISHTNLGALYWRLQKKGQAEAAWKEALRIAMELVRRHPAVVEYQRDLARCHNHLGIFYQAAGQLTPAEDAWKQALRIHDQLVANHPRITRYQSELAQTWNNLGFLYRRARRFREAEDAYRHAISSQEKLVRIQPDDLSLSIALGGMFSNQANLLSDMQQYDQALPWYEKAQEVLQALLQKKAQDATVREYLCHTHAGRAKTLARLQRFNDAHSAWAQAFEYHTSRLRDLLRSGQALTLALAGKHLEACEEAAVLANKSELSGERLYELAQVHAISSGGDPKLAEVRAWCAVDLLERARAAGYFHLVANRERLRQDGDFELLWNWPRFQKLVDDLDG